MKRLTLFFCCFVFAIISKTSAQSTAHYAKIKTVYGTMVFQLYNETPKHAANFLKLAKKGYFNRYDFNRVIKGFVAQGGETDSAYTAMEKEGKVLKRISPEFNDKLFHQKGALAAGRDDNKEKSSFLGQIYIVDGKKQTDQTLDAIENRIGNGFRFSAAARQAYKEVGGTPHLDQNYTVFGQLIKGMDVLQNITAQPVDKEGKPKTRIHFRVSALSKNEILALKAEETKNQ